MSGLILPNTAYINKFIPKNKFFEKVSVSSKVKDEFVDTIQKITWKYKLAQNTIGIKAAGEIEEIQIFELNLKQKIIPLKVISLIDKAIPYPILYQCMYEGQISYIIGYTKDGNRRYYQSTWNQDVQFDFHAINLEKVYQKIISAFIDTSPENSFDVAIDINNKKLNLTKEIEILKNKLKKTQQFNKQVEINKRIHQKKSELQTLSN